jgi:uncharacterized repeat protein (TIGR01451 family)
VATQTGTYQWVASYSGDANNNPALSPKGNEPVTTTQANPGITTDATPTGETVGGPALKDVAHLSGGYNPTGTITFTLYAPDNSVADTESVTVNGNGDYTTPTGSVPTQAGTYFWVASYGGDANNQGVTSGTHDEPVVISPASPTITTTPGGIVVIGSGAKLTDSATLSGGYGPTGTITFTLYAPDGTTVVDTETATVSGSGTYTTPTGYLPSAPGTYQWVASYGDDTNNNGVSNNQGDEPETVYAPVTIGDFVWQDSNANGLQDTGEAGIPSVTLTLTGTTFSGGSITDHATTDSSGKYLFTEVPGTYTVTVDSSNFTGSGALVGYNASPTLQGSDRTVDSNVSGGGTSPATLASGGSDLSVDFGYYKNVTIGDFVWNDSNANGIQDSGESGIKNVTLTLTGTNGSGGSVTDHATTDSSGKYLFTEAPGTYTVTVDSSNFTGTGALVGYNASPTLQGSDRTVDSNTNPSGTSPGTLAGGSSDLSVDFGYYKNVTIGDYVWNDSNANGIQNSGESGIQGVTLTLTGTNGAGVSVTDHATTDSSGKYLFTEAPGTYTVTVDSSNFTGSGALVGYNASPTLQGSDRTIDSNANPSGTSPATLAGGSSDLSVDFGYYKNVTIGDFVWNDSNANGIQDSGESGIKGVTLTLTGTNGAGVSVTDHATTDSSGKYLFTEAPGTYTVTVDSSNFTGSGALVGYNASPTLQGSDRTVDSNVSGGGTSPATLAGGSSDLSVDFGYYKNVTIGDFVWNDTNANGIQDSGESGIKNVTLTLTGTNGAGVSVTDHATTDSSGKYLFTEAPGTYTVTVDSSNFTGSGALVGYNASPTLQGSDRTVDSNTNPSGTSPGTLAGGSSDLTVDFGYYVPVTGTPDLAITKTADSTAVIAGQPIGFVVTIKNTGTADATGVSLNDPLPGMRDLSWTIASQSDSSNSGNSVTITGAQGNQVLTLTNNGNVTLHPGEVLTVHITSSTSSADTTGSSTATAPSWLGAAGDYGVLYTGTGGHNLSITNVTIHGNVGVGGTGVVQFSGPGTVGGRLDFSAANSGQYHNNNGSNVGPTSANYNVSAVTTALNTVTTLSSSLAGLGTSIAISGTQTINESSGQLVTVGGVTYRAFTVTSYSENDGKLVTINGDGSGVPVVFNFGFNSNVNLGGDVALTNGLTDDQVLWNFTTSGKAVSLNNNASSYPNLAFHGILLAPHDTISVTNANLSGRVFGGDSADMQIVSGDTIKAPLLNTATVTAGNVTFDSDDTATATVSITATAPLGTGQAATLGFWKNAGQAVILNFNGGATHTELGNWLAGNFPSLFGNLAGKDNTYVANYFKTGSTSNTYQQAFAVALDIYATTTSLGGASVISGGFTTKYGFKVSDNGDLYATWDVGSAAPAFDIPSGGSTVLTLYQIMKIADSHYNAAQGQFYYGSPNQSSYTDQLNTTLNNINSKADIKLTADSGSASNPADTAPLLGSIGDLLTGEVDVSVDSPLGVVTADEQARIDDAINTINAELGPYGITLVDVTGTDAAADAALRIHLADTSTIGGAADGVLGLTEFGGEITLIDTWNYYFGSDPNAVGADQYDFETVAMHELGHGLGLGHSTDANSVMYPYLASGQARRALTDNDIAVIDTDAAAAPEPLLAAPPAAHAVQTTTASAANGPSADTSALGTKAAMPEGPHGATQAGVLVAPAAVAAPGTAVAFLDTFAPLGNALSAVAGTLTLTSPAQASAFSQSGALPAAAERLVINSALPDAGSRWTGNLPGDAGFARSATLADSSPNFGSPGRRSAPSRTRDADVVGALTTNLPRSAERTADEFSPVAAGIASPSWNPGDASFAGCSDEAFAEEQPLLLLESAGTLKRLAVVAVGVAAALLQGTFEPATAPEDDRKRFLGLA